MGLRLLIHLAEGCEELEILPLPPHPKTSSPSSVPPPITNSSPSCPKDEEPPGNGQVSVHWPRKGPFAGGVTNFWGLLDKSLTCCGNSLALGQPAAGIQAPLVPTSCVTQVSAPCVSVTSLDFLVPLGLLSFDCNLQHLLRWK